ncbi:basic helix-loop-helix and HMG box domain-containing protein 1 isoform X1 [Lacerta agilis]|uniref:basic helix-loop-helix and HMG box domain-containing protein 1 isoform X1 n=2 Tax=Lacerta agilis TaxID=80427 RepID=UPI00141959E7|nr:basic helix-loop-helix and HMG box domain-containing protein 1 isoform X1 [Lacerta agilis]
MGMWDQIGCVCSEELQPNGKNSQQNSGDRRKCNKYTSTLKELAQMLPIPMRTSCKRLTKKEILLRVLHYIEHLQASVDTARSLLRVRCGEQKGGSEQMAASALKRGQREATPRAKKTKPLGVCKKPRKRRRTRKSERRGVGKKVCKCLALETGKGTSQADMGREESVSAVEEVSALLSSSQKQSPFFPSFQVPGSEYYRPASAPFLDITKDWNLGRSQEESKDGDVFSVCAAQVAYEELRQYSEGPGHSPMGQELVHYYSSCEEEEEEASRDSPWLSTQSPVNSSQAGSMQLCSPWIEAQSNTCSDLGLSPSLFTSPARLLPRHILHGSQDELSPVLFEDVYLSPQSSSFSQALSGTLLRKSAFTLDHCYLSYNETGKSNSSPVSRMNGRTSLWNKQYLQEETATARPEFPASSSDENSDSTWTPPSKRVRPSQVSCQKKMKKVVRRQRRRPAACEKRSSSSPLQLKKKCVNGFIMFCRLNRKHYIRACPGMASTAATRELAQLWRMMTKQERKPYCMKARRFSRLNNRIVRDDFSSGEEDPEPPKPFHMLLAEKSLHGSQTFGDLSLLKLIP